MAPVSIQIQEMSSQRMSAHGSAMVTPCNTQASGMIQTPEQDEKKYNHERIS